MIGFALLDDPIPLPKLHRDHLGMFYVGGERDPAPHRLAAPNHDGWPDVFNYFAPRHFAADGKSDPI